MSIFSKSTKTVVLSVEGMKCEKCAARVKSTLEKVRGVSAEISLDDASATVICPEKTDAAALAAAVTEAGFPASVRA